MIDLTCFCALCGASLKRDYLHWDEDDIDTMEDCSCTESGVRYSRRFRHEQKFGPTCRWFEEVGDSDSNYVATGPICGKPASFLSCMPYIRTPTCEEHKCRCAKPLVAPS